MEEQFYYLLYTNLIANCPVDTRNMVTNIVMIDHGDYWEISITAPKTSKSGEVSDYARAVNYRKLPRSAKETRNKHWVERTIKQTSDVIGEVKYELS